MSCLVRQTCATLFIVLFFLQVSTINVPTVVYESVLAGMFFHGNNSFHFLITCHDSCIKLICLLYSMLYDLSSPGGVGGSNYCHLLSLGSVNQYHSS